MRQATSSQFVLEYSAGLCPDKASGNPKTLVGHLLLLTQENEVLIVTACCCATPEPSGAKPRQHTRPSYCT
jgi:hypothetical protein